MTTVEITVIGLGHASASASDYIAETQRRLAEEDKDGYRMNATGTSPTTVEDLRYVALEPPIIATSTSVQLFPGSRCVRVLSPKFLL